MSLLKDDRPVVREGAVLGLAYYDAGIVGPTLNRVAKSDQSDGVRWAAKAAIRQNLING